MKKYIFKYYLTCFLFFCTIAIFAQPGSGNDTNNLEGTDAPAAPIDNYIWILVLAGLLFVFMKLRALQNKKS